MRDTCTWWKLETKHGARQWKKSKPKAASGSCWGARGEGSGDTKLCVKTSAAQREVLLDFGQLAPSRALALHKGAFRGKAADMQRWDLLRGLGAGEQGLVSPPSITLKGRASGSQPGAGLLLQRGVQGSSKPISYSVCVSSRPGVPPGLGHSSTQTLPARACFSPYVQMSIFWTFLSHFLQGKPEGVTPPALQGCRCSLGAAPSDPQPHRERRASARFRLSPHSPAAS